MAAPASETVRPNRRQIPDWVPTLVLAVAGLGLIGLGWSAVCTVPGVSWNAPRLAPAFALKFGLPIYAVRESGAQLGWVYGPVFPLWFWPTTLPSNLTVALMAAGAWNIATIVLPIFFVVRSALPGASRVAGPITLLGAALLLANSVTQTAFFYVHVDALCIAFGLWAAAALHAAATRASRVAWHGAALALVLAIWTKQLAITLVPATLLWLWREGQARQLERWLKLLLFYGAAVTLVFFFAFGPEELWFNLWFFPARNPSHTDWAALGTRLWELCAGGWLWWLAGGTAWRAARSLGDRAVPPLVAPLVRLLGWMAVCQIPFGVSAALKIGGGNNSFHALNYGLVAALVAVVAWISADPIARDERRRFRARLGCAGLALVAVIAGGKFVARRDAVWRPDRGQEELLAYAQRHAGKLYLPWNPLITIISDRKIYPFDDALLCLWRARLEPPRDAIRRAIPAGAEVLYQASNQSHFALSYLDAPARVAEPPHP